MLKKKKKKKNKKKNFKKKQHQNKIDPTSYIQDVWSFYLHTFEACHLKITNAPDSLSVIVQNFFNHKILIIY